MDTDGHLLEGLRRELGCVYLSELREAHYRIRAVRRAAELPPEDYPLSQWRDAAAYLTHTVRAFETVEQVRDFLASYGERE